ncbi:hypothetical protein OO013_18930 [Mangrovivirga sp. M17]|uniref:Cell surface protein n=1 Tax=Mangrovivirga halotolerans TaxID=2993936 RepID=A0ABT3RX83_9BACT|nr:hypothetical protein [Mangrovivirga halotolerans]MCX2745963.1 hypothetical protein [Mangrovivirga halotolerans]
MKKLLNSILAFALIAGFLTLQSCSEDETPKQTSNEITSLSVSGGTSVSSGNRYIVEVPAGTDLTNIMVNLEVSEGATVTPESGQAVDFSTGWVTYEVTSESGSTQAFEVYVTNDGTVTYNSGTYTDADFFGAFDYYLVATEDYLFDGLVYIEEGSSINIPAGTMVKFVGSPTTGDNTSSLIIAAGAQIFAEGTATDPIIFTAQNDDDSGTTYLATDNAQWGGLIILGNAPASKGGVTQGIAIEGISSEETRGQYGGNNPDDNSGILKYVSIRYTGIGLAVGDEIQGLTLGGVGAGTTIDYIDIFSTADDGIEIFGGTVNIKHISVAFSTDDDFDFDLGWRGNAQFLFSLFRSDADGFDHAGEWDGASPDGADLFAAPNVYNYTAVGPGQDAPQGGKAILMRDAFGGKLVNSVFVDFPSYAIEIEDRTDTDVDSYGRLTTEVQGYRTEVLNNTWSQFGNYDGTVESVVLASEDDGALITDVVAELADNNNTITNDLAITSLNRGTVSADDVVLDPRPATNDTNVITNVPNGIEAVNYRGAFSAGEPTWLSGWSTLSKFGYVTE